LTRLLLLIAVIIWGSTFVASKICLGVMSPVQLVAGRFLIAAPALFVIARLRAASFRLGAHKKVLFLAAVLFSFHYLLQTSALEFTTATNSGWLVAVAPLSIALLAALFLREPTPPVAGIVVASLGILLLVSQGDLSRLGALSSAGDFMVLASTLTWAVFTIITRNPSRSLDPVVVTFVMTVPLAVSALVLPLVLDRWTPWSELGREALLVLVFLGLAGVALAQWFWQRGVAKLGAAQAGVFLYLEPLATTALAVPFLGEPFSPVTAVGGLLVVLGVILARRTVPRVSGPAA
jgi:drug/metabolite transporter (DMT)-like permease